MLAGKVGWDCREFGSQDCFKNGRGERIRTSDPLVPNQVLYQAEPLPVPLVRCVSTILVNPVDSMLRRTFLSVTEKSAAAHTLFPPWLTSRKEKSQQRLYAH